MTIDELIEQSTLLRARYHALERTHHGSEWTVEEDALAFLTDAGLVGRMTMAQQGRWPKDDAEAQLAHKLAECMWWVTVLAQRTNVDLVSALERFFAK